MAAYARQAKDSELIEYATEIKVRAERRCGELLARTEKNTGARMNGGGEFPAVERCDSRETPTLADMGLTRDESSRYQQLAAMPAEHFETAVSTAKATAGEQVLSPHPQQWPPLRLPEAPAELVACRLYCGWRCIGQAHS